MAKPLRLTIKTALHWLFSELPGRLLVFARLVVGAEGGGAAAALPEAVRSARAPQHVRARGHVVPRGHGASAPAPTPASSSASPQVRRQAAVALVGAQVAEAASALLAAVRGGTAVDALVRVEVAQLLEAPATLGTSIRAFTCVHLWGERNSSDETNPHATEHTLLLFKSHHQVYSSAIRDHES